MSVAWGRAEVPGTRSTQRDHDHAAVLGGQQQGFRDRRASVRLILLGFGQAVPLRYSVASLLFGGMSLFLVRRGLCSGATSRSYRAKSSLG